MEFIFQKMYSKIEGKRKRGQQKMRQHHQLDGHEFEQMLGDSKGQGSLTCCNSWGHKELVTTYQLNNNIVYKL